MTLRGVFENMRSGYKSLAVVAFDLFVVLLVANLVAYPFFRPAPTLSDVAVETERKAWLDMNGIETFRRVYPDRSEADLNALLRSTPVLGQLFAPYIQVKSEPMITRGIAIHEDGFRLIGREQ